MSGLDPKYSPRKASELFEKLLASKAPGDGQLGTLLASDRFAARPVRARGLTRTDVFDGDAPLGWQQIVPANPARRLLVFTFVDLLYYVQPSKPPTIAHDSIRVDGTRDYLVIDEQTWGAFVTVAWLGIQSGIGTHYRYLEETYLS